MKCATSDNLTDSFDRVYAHIMNSEKLGYWCYLITFCYCFIALGIRLAIAPEDGGLQFVTFFPTVAITTLLYGTSAGLLATVVCSIMSAYFLFEPYESFVFTFEHKTILALFVFNADGLLVSLSIGMMHRYFIKYHQNLRELEAALHQSQENEAELNYQKYALDQHAIVAITDVYGTITYVNERFCAISRYEKEELLGKNHRILNSDTHSEEFFANMYCTITEGSVWHGDICNRAKDGSLYWVATTIVPFLDRNGKPVKYVSIRTDITERKRNQEIISQLAFYDPLTKLANRRLLHDRLEHSLLESERSKEYGALMFLDLDKFKPLNDEHGHEAGDELLIEVGKRLKCSVREIDTVARFGGDEFVILLNKLGKTEVEAKEISSEIAEKIRCSLAEPYQLNIGSKTIKHKCTASIGVVNFLGTTRNQTEIFKQADDAMYKSKNNGRNVIHYI